MVLIDNNFRKRYASLVKRARVEKIRVVRLEPGLFFVARKAKGHNKYIVTVKETHTGIFATCRQVYGAACPSFGCCTHIAAWHERAVADGRRELKKEQAA